MLRVRGYCAAYPLPHGQEGIPLPQYVIEREIPGAGQFTPEQLKGISQTSCGVLSQMGPQIQWHQHTSSEPG